MLEKAVKQKMPYIGNGIPSAFFARPVLTYRKFNTQILMNDELNMKYYMYSASMLEAMAAQVVRK